MNIASSGRPLRCEFCGATSAPMGKSVRRLMCERCATLDSLLLTKENGGRGAREVMINQHPREPHRKLLELSSHSVVVFFDDALRIVGLEIDTKDGARALRWDGNGRRIEFRVHNIGKGYANHDRMVPERGFDREGLRRDIAVSRENLRPEILSALEDAAA